MNLQTYRSLDATDLAELIRKKEMTPKELVLLSFQQLERVNPELNAVTSHRKERVLAEVERFQAMDQPLGGVPMLLKNISQTVQGEKMTAGSKLLQSNVSEQDSNLVKRLRESGILMLGHTNAPEFGLKNISEPELHGPTRNPWNKRYSPGGSSGGSAAAVASGIVPIAGASDGGGSIRIPASFTGLFGLKPTRGRTPVGPGTGRQWQGAAIDFAVSRSVRDSATMLDLLQTIQPEAAFQTPLFQGYYRDERRKGWDKPLRVAVSMESPVGTPVSEDARLAVRKTTKWLEDNGHEVEEVTPEIDGKDLMRNYYLMNCGEMSAVILTLEKALGRPLSEKDMEIETWLLNQAGKSVTAAEFTMSLAAWDTAAAKMADFHKAYDFYITPATAFIAPDVGELTHSKESKEKLLDEFERGNKQELIYEMFLPSLTYTPFTQLANLTGQPAMSVPVYVSDQGMPLGIQVMASKGREDLLLRLAFQMEQSELWEGMNENPYFEG
ncbi:amidase [Salipaludibacillus keqinensis]|uniref:Amidase n=1 Tax=Salipaludibacillus keqinensis TaxID=2045207 RepID=A0A323TA97_9BACI|nr:amidase [Salipaludibacillus keqinensis]PYZ92209.1 amidase [Salipaludibacillus keqinensis]